MRATVILLFIAATLCAQERDVTLGMQLGPSMAGYRGFSGSFATEGPNFSISSYFLLKFSKHFSLRGGAGFERKGTIFVLDDPGIGPFIQPIAIGMPLHTHRLDYVVLPLLLRLYTSGRIRCFGSLGGYTSIPVNVENKLGDISLLTVFPSKLRGFNRLQLGWSTGGGIEIPLRKSWVLSFELRENFDLIPIANFFGMQTRTLNFLFGIGRVL